MKLKNIAIALLLAGASLVAQASVLKAPLPLPQYSGVIRLSAPLPESTPMASHATIYPKVAGKAVAPCKLYGKVWAARAASSPYEPHGDGLGVIRFVSDVPGTMRIVCPDQLPVVVFGKFEGLPRDPAWVPAQHAVRTPGDRASNAKYETLVENGVYGRGVTWAVMPERLR